MATVQAQPVEPAFPGVQVMLTHATVQHQPFAMSVYIPDATLRARWTRPQTRGGQWPIRERMQIPFAAVLNIQWPSPESDDAKHRLPGSGINWAKIDLKQLGRDRPATVDAAKAVVAMFLEGVVA